jgi:hypothetical protein
MPEMFHEPPSEPRHTSPEHEAKEFLTVEHVSKLLFKSFYFTQGDEASQVSLMGWLHAAYPAYAISEEVKPKLAELFTEQAGKIIYPKSGAITHPEVPENYFKAEVARSVERIYEILNGTSQGYIVGKSRDDMHDIAIEGIPKDEFVLDVFNRVIFQENLFLEYGNPRNPYDTGFFQSLMCEYCLLGRPTGLPEYDEFFKEAREMVYRELKLSEEPPHTQRLFKTQLQHVVEAFNARNPERTISLP